MNIESLTANANANAPTITVGDLTPSTAISGAVTSVYFDLETLEVEAFTFIGSAYPMRAHHGFQLFLGTVPPECLDPESLREAVLEFSPELLILAKNWEEYFNNSNRKARLSNDGLEALETVREEWQAELERSAIKFWTAAEYWGQIPTEAVAREVVGYNSAKAWALVEVEAAALDNVHLQVGDVRIFGLDCVKETLETALNDLAEGEELPAHFERLAAWIAGEG